MTRWRRYGALRVRIGLAAVIALSMLGVGCSASPTEETDLSGLQEIADEIGGIVAVGTTEGTVHVAAGVAATGDELATTDGFMLWSTTKMITAISVLTMVDKGLIALDEPIATYVEFPVHPDMTMRHLLQHTSGMPDVDPNPCITEELAEVYKSWAKNPRSQPGAQTSYSTPALNLVSLIIESVTEMQAHDYQRQAIFEPLGMDSTYYAAVEPGPAIFHDAARCEDPPYAIETGGGLASTVADMDLFLRAAFAGDLISDESREQFMSGDVEVFGAPYGLGSLALTHPDGRTIHGHGGSLEYETAGMYEPATGRTVIVLMTKPASLQDTVWVALDWHDAASNGN